MPDVSLMINARRMLWIKRFIDKGNNLSKECMSKAIPDFHRKCLQDWSEMFNEIPCVLAQPLWNNTLSTFYYKNRNYSIKSNKSKVPYL